MTFRSVSRLGLVRQASPDGPRLMQSIISIQYALAISLKTVPGLYRISNNKTRTLSYTYLPEATNVASDVAWNAPVCTNSSLAHSHLRSGAEERTEMRRWLPDEASVRRQCNSSLNLLFLER